jgi:hypothetical protein
MQVRHQGGDFAEKYGDDSAERYEDDFAESS